jgi:hypothetical protein
MLYGNLKMGWAAGWTLLFNKLVINIPNEINGPRESINFDYSAGDAKF